MVLRSVTAHWRTAVLAVVIVTATAGGAGAKAVYDAQNADKVDGFHAVGSGATLTQKAGKLVAAGTNGRLPDSAKLGGYSHTQMATMSIPAQSAHVNSGATMTDRGADLNGTNSGDITIGFVIPPDHKPGTPISMRVLYEEDSFAACSWYVYADGLVGPDAPSTDVNIHNGTWRVPGTTDFQGAIPVAEGPDNFHQATFTKPAGSLTDPGMFMDFHLTRDPTDAADTCSDVFILGFEVRY